MPPRSRKGWRKKCDDMWSDLVNGRANGHCEFCGKPAKTQAHHLICRTKPHTRHDPGNGMALCFYCHKVAHNQSTLFWNWFNSDKFRAKRFESVYKKAYQSSGKVDYSEVCDKLQKLIGGDES